MTDEPAPEIVERIVYVERIRYVPDSHRREPPAKVDVLATYDAVWRKHPKRIFGFGEIGRALPWFVAPFHGRVPPENFVVEEDGQAAVRCRCEAVTYVPFNRIADCEGGCGRTFGFTGSAVHVARRCPRPGLALVGDRVCVARRSGS